jgi:hypothetical protein
MLIIYNADSILLFNLILLKKSEASLKLRFIVEIVGEFDFGEAFEEFDSFESKNPLEVSSLYVVFFSRCSIEIFNLTKILF